jgi:NAD(P)-dependent dehydrogenase (short-subunit alcohol dehydrogenase family)
MKLKDKVALITGGNKGIGLAIARRYAKEGATSIILARDKTMGDKAIADIRATGGKAHFITCDLTKFASLPGIVGEATALAGGVDILVNNAGVVDLRPLEEVTPENWDFIFDTNVKGLFFMLQAAAAQMIAQGRGGKVINVSSQAGRRGEGLVLVYGAAKAAVIHMNQTAALELIKHRINVNGIAPGVIDTPMWDDVDAQFCKYKGLPKGSARKMAEAGVPHGRFGVPNDLAGAAVFLASDDAEYIVAQTLNVDGGNWMS